MDKFRFWDREGHAHAPASCGYDGKRFLQAACVAPIGGGGHCDREVVDVGDHEAFGDRCVEWGDVEKEEEGGDRGPLGGADGNWDGEVGRALED